MLIAVCNAIAGLSRCILGRAKLEYTYVIVIIFRPVDRGNPLRAWITVQIWCAMNTQHELCCTYAVGQPSSKQDIVQTCSA